jgi:hypothetical protein
MQQTTTELGLKSMRMLGFRLTLLEKCQMDKWLGIEMEEDPEAKTLRFFLDSIRSHRKEAIHLGYKDLPF